MLKSSLKDFLKIMEGSLCLKKKTFLLKSKLGYDGIPQSLQMLQSLLLQSLGKSWPVTVIPNFFSIPDIYGEACKWTGT